MLRSLEGGDSLAAGGFLRYPTAKLPAPLSAESTRVGFGKGRI